VMKNAETFAVCRGDDPSLYCTAQPSPRKEKAVRKEDWKVGSGGEAIAAPWCPLLDEHESSPAADRSSMLVARGLVLSYKINCGAACSLLELTKAIQIVELIGGLLAMI
jgi:hypothetical protein